jgi:hypothetical protein
MPATNVRSYTDEQILNRVKEKAEGFKEFPNGVLDVWVRSDEDEFNRFDDKVYTFECTGGDDITKQKFIMVCSGTTNAGKKGLLEFDAKKKSGCAVLKSDVIVYNSHVFGDHSGKPAYVQSRNAEEFVPFPYYRDANRDTKCDETGEIFLNRIGANCHRAGPNSTQIDGWSIACLVRNNEAQFLKWLEYMDERPLTVCILKEWEP